jgi:diguanylate cyclase (GGDEF)-like protein
VPRGGGGVQPRPPIRAVGSTERPSSGLLHRTGCLPHMRTGDNLGLMGSMQDAGEHLSLGAWFEAVSSALLLLTGDARTALAGNAEAARLLDRPAAWDAGAPALPLEDLLGPAPALVVARHVAAPTVAMGTWLPLLLSVRGETRHIGVACRRFGEGWLATIERRESIAAIEVPDGTFRRVLDAVPIGIDLFDRDYRAVFCNEYLIRTLGYYGFNSSPTFDAWFESAYPDPIYRAEAEVAWNTAVEAVRAGAPVADQGEWWVRCEDGQTRRLRFILQPFGRFNLQITLDMTERYRADSDLLRLAFFDELTGASTRVHFRQEAEKLAARARSEGLPVTLMLLDVDHFKAVNDRYGHGAGDTVLREVVGRCRAVVGEGAVVCRLGGDEFVVMLSPADRRGPSAVAAAVLQAVVGTPVEVGPLAVPVSASIGVFAGDPRGLTLDRMMELADRALYAAKHDGRACVRFAGPA